MGTRVYRWATLIVGISILGALAGCGGTSSAQQPVTVMVAADAPEPVTVTVTETVAETVTVTETAAVTETGSDLAGAFPKGFPKEIPMSQVPEQMRSDLGADEGVTTAIALAPGVWTRNAPGTSVEEDALYGAQSSISGWCSSVEKFQRDFGSEAGGSCW